MLDINDISLRFAGRPLFNEACAHISDGQKVGLTGKNGSGKSTLFKIILGDLAADSGEIRITKGQRIASVAQEVPDGDTTLLQCVLDADKERSELLKMLEAAEQENDGVRIAEIHERLNAVAHKDRARILFLDAPRESGDVVDGARLVGDVDHADEGRLFIHHVEQRIGTMTDFDLSFLDGFKLHDPQLNFGVRTNAGIPVLFDIAYVKAYREDEAGNPVAGSEVFASFGGSQSTTLDIANVAEMPGLWGGENWFRFDRESAQTNALFATDPLPNALEFAYSAQAGERTDGQWSFLTPDAAVHVVREAVVPLWFDESAEGSEIVIRDTITGLELDSLMPEGIVLEQALLALNIENGLPVGFELALDAFLDADGRTVDVPMERSYKLDMPDVDTDGRIPQGAAAQPVPWEINVDQQAYDALRQVNSIVYSIHLRQEAGKRVRFEQSNYFGLQVGVYVKGEVNSSIMGE